MADQATAFKCKFAEPENASCTSPVGTTVTSDFARPPSAEDESSTILAHNNAPATKTSQSLDGKVQHSSECLTTIDSIGSDATPGNVLRRPESEETVTSKQPRRNSTMDTKASAPFEDTEVWDRKAILSLGMTRHADTPDDLAHISSFKKQTAAVSERVPKARDFPGGQNYAFDENRCRVVVVAYQEPHSGGVGTPYLFRTYKNLHRSKDPQMKSLDRNPGPAHDIPIWEVARATSAAPTYFKPPKIDSREYLDGGFGDTNNPSLEIYDEVRRMNNNSNKCISLVISVGTGKNKKMSRWPKTKNIFGAKILNYINFAKAWASQSETQHEKMLREKAKFQFMYVRFNVEDGLDSMKLDEWKTSARAKVAVGKWVGKARKSRRSNGKADKKGQSYDGQEKGNSSGSSASSASTATEENVANKLVPEWLRPRNKTLETITKRTEEYLQNADVQQQIEECARKLVEGRRARARMDPQRWEKACFGAWYQCVVDGCPRGEKEYLDRRKMRSHLLDKHGDVYKTTGEEDIKALEATLDHFKIIVR
ncbi:MAG: hypothetical protein LQ338_006779 [Usnochroma carphineum]|nr:MAG: hypothetical protein LQ338_006779 [Usnochroma carphineum]